MKKYAVALLIFALTLGAGSAWAHFGMVIPDKNIVTKDTKNQVNFMLLFWHPFELKGMNLVKPAEFGVFVGGKKTSLLKTLKAGKLSGKSVWTTSYKIKKPADYIFYMVPKPYWEPEEDCFIIHYTKTIVSAYGKEEGWDTPVGLKVEIIPLTKPYGLYAGNSFTGKVLFKGKPLPNAEVEVEYFNQKGDRKAPSDSHVTQLVKTDSKGVFTFSMPWPGWWGFAALTTDDKRMKLGNKEKNVEVGGVLWIYLDR